MGNIPTSRQPHVKAYIGRPDGQTWVDVSSCLRSMSIDCGSIEQVGTQASGADGAIRRLRFSLQNEGALREYWPEDIGREETDEIGDDTDILADDWDSVAVVINTIFGTANKWARDSFSQLDRDSYWNQFDGEFSPLLYSRREVEIQAAVTAPGQQPAAMFSLFRGYLGERVSTDGGTVEVSARDLAKRLQDAYIYIEREYGSDTETVPIETVMQQILDDNLGEGEVTLHCPEPTGRACRPYSPIDMSVWDALWQLTSQWGGWLGYAWDTQQGEYVLTLMMPPRDKGPENADFVFNASDIYVENLETYDDDIRNLVVVRYYDEIEKRVKTVIERDEDSIREFGERVMVIQTERLTTEAQARALAQLALHDLADYPATVEITLPFLPEMHLFAGILVTNPRISTRQEFYGVVSFRHELSWGEDSARFRTVVVAAGRVTGGHHRWLRMETRPGSPGRVASQLSGKVTTFFQDDPPTAKAIGDIWYDTDANPVVIRRWNGLSWVDITTTALSAALRAAQDAQDTADGKVTTYHADTEPEAEAIGDLWIDTSDDNKLYRWSGSAWVDIRDGLISTHSTQIANLADEVDSKITIFYQDNQPTANVVGDIWYDTDADPVTIKRWNGTQWIDITTTALSAALDAAGDAQATADGKIKTFYQTAAPSGSESSTGDLWVDTDDGNRLYRYSGTQWVDVADMTPIDADERPISAASGQVYIGEPGIAVANGAMIFVSGTFSHDQLGRLITAAVDRPITTDPGGQRSVSAPVEISAARGHEVYKGKLNVWAGTGGAGDTRYIHDGRVTDDGIIGMDALKLTGTVAMENLPAHLLRTAPGVSGAVMYYARTPIVELGPKATMQLTFTTAMPYVPELLVIDRRGFLSDTLEFDNVSKTGFRITNTHENYWIRPYDNVSFFWIALCASHDPSTSSCDNCQEECQGDCQQSVCQASCEGAAGCQQGCELGGQMPCDGTCQDVCMFSCQLPPPDLLWT